MNLLHKESNKEDIGESWEVSGVSDNISIVSNSDLKGTSLRELIEIFTSEFLGKKVYQKYGNNFPLLIKFIDAQKPLSIQVHPNDTVAKQKHNSFGKTEMWYIMESDQDAELVVGFKKESNKEEYLYHLEKKSLLEILNVEKVEKGDCYFIPAGRVHAIGAGVLLAEIQQTSDITYRIYDWDRKDIDGNYRDLHIKDAVEVIDYTVEKNYKTSYSIIENTSSRIISCPYFATNILKVFQSVSVDNNDKDSFVIYMCVSGKVNFKYENIEERLIKGETILVPSCIKEFTITSEKEAELLEVYIP